MDYIFKHFILINILCYNMIFNYLYLDLRNKNSDFLLKLISVLQYSFYYFLLFAIFSQLSLFLMKSKERKSQEEAVKNKVIKALVKRVRGDLPVHL